MVDERRSEIVLVGPPRVGKSTVAARVAHRLGIACVHLDGEREDMYQQCGFRTDIELCIEQAFGFRGVYQYWKVFEALTLERCLSEYRGCVFDCGAGHVLYDDSMLRAISLRAISPFRNIVLLWPCTSESACRRLLTSRGVVFDDSEAWVLDLFLDFRRWEWLGARVVHTLDRTVDDIATEIIAICDL